VTACHSACNISAPIDSDGRTLALSRQSRHGFLLDGVACLFVVCLGLVLTGTATTLLRSAFAGDRLARDLLAACLADFGLAFVVVIQRYHESLKNLMLADVYFSRAEAILRKREKIKEDAAACSIRGKSLNLPMSRSLH
jgi:hypothetical protein